MSGEYLEFHGIRALSAVDAFGIAAAGSKMKELKLLLADGVDINAIASYSKLTALCAAAGKGATRAVTWLLEQGAEVDRPDQSGMTALMHACGFGKAKGMEIAVQLLEAGANVNAVRVSDGMTPLKFSIQGVNAELVELLLVRGADVDGPPGTEQTALMLAARNNFVGALEVLVRHGADLNRPCGLKWAGNRTARGLAEMEKRKQAVAFFQSLEAK